MIINRFRAWLAQQLMPAPETIDSLPGRMVNHASPGIEDGLRYDMPILMPHFLREDLERRGILNDYLTEAARDTFRFQFDTPQRSAADLPVQPTTEDPLREWSFSTRRMVLSTCHSAYNRNPLLNTAVQFTADFVIGNGFNLSCKNHEVSEYLEAFMCNPDNNIRTYERQAIIDLQVDGELMIQYFEGEDDAAGQVVIVPLRPWECDWIKTEKGFFRRPVSYRFQRYVTEGDYPGGEQSTEIEEIDAKQILHVPINNHAYELRGRPELYRVLAWARADSEFLENRARQNHWRNALLWLVSVSKATPAAMASVIARWSKPPSPGSIGIETENVDIKPLTNGVGAGDAMEDGRQIKNRVIMGLRLPEYFFADGYNSNLATASAQAMPALTKFSAFQTIMVEQVWYPLFKRVLTCAIEAGLLPEEVELEDSEGDTVYEEPDDTDDMGEMPDMMQPGALSPNGTMPMMQPRIPKMIDTLEAFDISYAPLESGDKLNLINALGVAMDRDIMSKQTVQEEFGVDPDIEAKRMEREEKQNMEKMQQGLKPPRPDMLDKVVNPPDNTTTDMSAEPVKQDAMDSEVENT